MGRFFCRRCLQYKYFVGAAVFILFIQISLFYKFSFDMDSRTQRRNGHEITNGKDPPVSIPRREVRESYNTMKDNVTVPMLFKPKCKITASEALSAIRRSKAPSCKQEIADVACLIMEGRLYPPSLESTCPYKGNFSRGHYIGCFKDEMRNRDLTFHKDFPTSNSPASCVDYCLLLGYKYAGLQYSKECWCGLGYGMHGKEEENRCNSPCTGDNKEKCGGYLANSVYSTGLREKIKTDAFLVSEETLLELKEDAVKIVFVLTLNGRQVRQVRRLIKAIYHKDHFYYLHIDKRQEFLYRELLPLEEQFSNIRLARKRFSTIWGGASLLQAHLHLMESLLKMTNWNWDYYINLSESDYPIKRIKVLEAFLTKYKGGVFVRSHGRDTAKFIQKQGLDQTFYECENHLWRVGPRRLPTGIRIDGGSDWIGLPRDFIKFILYSKSKLVEGLKQVYKYTLLPAESFFHSVLHNTEFCDKFIDNNLHVTNWRRKQGCKCQYKHIVDWCGCSPNDFTSNDLDRLLAFERKPTFFARKFEAVVNQDIINSLDLYLFGKTNEEMSDHYWQNDFHYLDSNTRKKDEYHSFYLSFIRRASRNLEVAGTCRVRPLKLLEVNLLYVSGLFHGLLALYSAEDVISKKSVVMETHAQWTKHYSVLKPEGPIGRLTSLEVGTDFDLKELIFRNYAQLLGPRSDLVLRHVWGQGAEFMVSVAWIDPANVVAASFEVKIPNSNGLFIGNHKPSLSGPLRPGVWTVKLMYRWVIVAETKFLVAPFTVIHDHPINRIEAEMLHSGPNGTYTTKSFAEFRDILKINKSFSYINEARHNSYKIGAELEHWVDSLTKQFWTIQSTCSVDIQHCPLIDHCKGTSWSSQSPDQKSEIRGINEQTGYLIR